MTKEDILNYVMNSPENTNRMVLSDMLDEFNSSGGGGPMQEIFCNISEFVDGKLPDGSAAEEYGYFTITIPDTIPSNEWIIISCAPIDDTTLGGKKYDEMTSTVPWNPTYTFSSPVVYLDTTESFYYLISSTMENEVTKSNLVYYAVFGPGVS